MSINSQRLSNLDEHMRSATTWPIPTKQNQNHDHEKLWFRLYPWVLLCLFLAVFGKWMITLTKLSKVESQYLNQTVIMSGESAKSYLLKKEIEQKKEKHSLKSP